MPRETPVHAYIQVFKDGVLEAQPIISNMTQAQANGFISQLSLLLANGAWGADRITVFVEAR